MSKERSMSLHMATAFEAERYFLVRQAVRV